VNAITSYAMLHVSYRFDMFGGRNSSNRDFDEDFNEERQRGGRGGRGGFGGRGRRGF
jgi:hypothetical protein